MADRRGSRFVLEVLFLLALAVALTLAKLDPLEIAGIMLLGWVIAAALEWAAWRNEPHYGSGLPPRYYVPRVNLPPAQPLEQVLTGYPEAQRDEAPTWIASAALRAEVLGEWPVATADEPAAVIEDAAADPWTVAELPPSPVGEPQSFEPQPVEPPPVEPQPVEPQPVEPEPVEPQAVEQAEPEPEPEPEPGPMEEPEPPQPDTAIVAGTEAEARPEPPAAVALARYSLDPLGDPEPRRRFGRRGALEGAALEALEVPARPVGTRALPGDSRRPD
jgi:hypothetical protein